MTKRSLLSRIGPAFIVGACIIGPGSVTVMSTTGANYGYRMIWLSLLAGALMAGFLAIFMRFGIYCDDTFLGLTAKKLGRWFAVPLGTIAMVVVLFDKRATSGRPLARWAKAFVIFGAALLLGIAALMYVKIRPELYRVLGIE